MLHHRQKLNALKSRVNKFAKKHAAKYTVALIVVEGKNCTVNGSELLCQDAVFTSSVRDACKAALSQQEIDSGRGQTDIEMHRSSSLVELLSDNVYDMDVGLMRAILGQAAGPPKAESNKDRRRNWYQDKNAPEWCTRTGLPFQSASHPKGHQAKRFDREQLWTLVSALQEFYGILPEPARKRHTKTPIVNILCGDDDVEDYSGGSGRNAVDDVRPRQDEQEVFICLDSIDGENTEVIEKQSHGDNNNNSIGGEIIDNQNCTVSDPETRSQDCSDTNNVDDTGYQEVTVANINPVATNQDCIGGVLNDSNNNNLEDSSQVTKSNNCTVTEPDTDNPNCVDCQAMDIEDSVANQGWKTIVVMCDYLRACPSCSSTGKKILHMLSEMKWNDLRQRAPVFLAHLPQLTNGFGTNPWTSLSSLPVDKRFQRYIPKEFEAVDVPHDGNCIFSSLAIHFLCDAELGMLMKVLFCIQAIEFLEILVKQVMDCFGDEFQEWMLQSLNEPGDDLWVCCEKELRNTMSNPYKEAGLFHLQLSALIFGQAIHQHCIISTSKAYQPYNCALYPVKLKSVGAFHLIWLPSRCDKRAPVSHVIAARPNKYGFLQSASSVCGSISVGRCICANDCQSLKRTWVQCSDCEQWFHCNCVGVTIEMVEHGRWVCGCHLLQNGKINVDVTWCSAVDSILAAMDKVNFPELCKKQLPWFRDEKHRKLCVCMPQDTTGPFSSAAVTLVKKTVARVLGRYTNCTLESYVQEALLQLIVVVNGMNRFVGEMVLLGIHQGSDTDDADM